MVTLFLLPKTCDFRYECMIVIEQGESNDVVVTVTEKTTLPLASAKYLFVFTHQLTGAQNTCIAANISNFRDRYDRFTITESNTEARTTGTLALPNIGEYNYTIYAQLSTSNLDPANADEVVEVGIAQIISGNVPYTDAYEVPRPPKTAYKVPI
jgi:hypothetical protein